VILVAEMKKEKHLKESDEKKNKRTIPNLVIKT
jgi:hypothetical protein